MVVDMKVFLHGINFFTRPGNLFQIVLNIFYKTCFILITFMTKKEYIKPQKVNRAKKAN